MYTCFDIACFFLKKAQEEGYGLDPMKLLKITYIAHGWHLAFHNKPLFLNRIEAWRHGPVIPDLYHEIKEYGYGYVELKKIMWRIDKVISPEDEEKLSPIWHYYKQYTGLELSAKTHENDTPWDKTIKIYGENSVIPEDIIKTYYLKLKNEHRA